MEASTARKIAFISTGLFVVLLAMGGGLSLTILLAGGAIMLGLESPRDVLYAVQRCILWPLGIHLNDERWMKAHDLTDLVLRNTPPFVFGLGVILTLFIWRHRIRRYHRLVLNGYRPKEYPTCTNCWYNLTGNETGVCPECGTPVSPQFAEGFASYAMEPVARAPRSIDGSRSSPPESPATRE